MPEQETAKDVFEAMQLYQDDVYRAALMAAGNFADAEDILQDVFLKYYQSHPVFASPSHEKAWLLRCAINAGHDLRRSIWVSCRADAELDSFAESAGEEHSDVLRADWWSLGQPSRSRLRMAIPCLCRIAADFAPMKCI